MRKLFTPLLALGLLVVAGVATMAVDGSAWRTEFLPGGGRYMASPATLTDTQQDELRLNAAGELRTAPGVGASVDVNAGKLADVDAAVAAATGLRLMGYSARESASTAAVATLAIVHGATADGGTVITRIELLPNESRSEWFGPGGIAAASGLSVDITAGTADIDLFYRVAP